MFIFINFGVLFLLFRMATEQGNQHSGLGIIQWWGLSPAIDLSEVILKGNKSPDELNLSLIHI